GDFGVAKVQDLEAIEIPQATQTLVRNGQRGQMKRLERAAAGQFVEERQTVVRNPSAVKRQFDEPGHALQMSQAGVADAGLVEKEVVQLRQFRQFGQAGVGDGGVRKP